MTLKPAWFHILLAIADQPRHGADIQRRVREMTDGDVILYPATLYGSLADMEDGELIREVGEGEGRPPDANERRRYYALTAEGRRALRAEAERLGELAERARRALGAESIG